MLIAEWAKVFSLSNWPELPHEIQDRDADLWESLIAVADAIGGKWPSLAREAAITLTAAAKDSEPSLGIQLLADLRDIFGERDYMPTRTILAELAADEEKPWADMRGKPLESRGLANLLKEYGIRSVTVRMGTITVKGYRRADLVDVWRRYLPAQADNSDTSVTNGTSIADSASAVSDVTDVSGLGKDEGDDDGPFGEAA